MSTGPTNSSCAHSRNLNGSTNRDLVSVVIPCYNHGHFLSEAIESAIAQTHRPVEIIVVDDGSTDTTSAVVARHSQVCYIRKENAGLAAARNTGLRASRGEYLCFLDADDRLYPKALQMGLACFVQSPDCGFVFGGHRVLNEGQAEGLDVRPDPTQASYVALLRANHVRMCAAALFRRSILVDVGGFDETLQACEDYDVYLRIARYHAIGNHAEIIAEYRRHGQNMSADTGLMLRAVLQVFGRHGEHVGPGPEHRRAWRAGRIRYQQFYGYRLLGEALKGIRLEKKWASGLRDCCVVVRYAPWAFLVPVAKRFGQTAKSSRRPSLLTRSVGLLRMLAERILRIR